MKCTETVARAGVTILASTQYWINRFTSSSDFQKTTVIPFDFTAIRLSSIKVLCRRRRDDRRDSRGDARPVYTPY